jgi:plastocyanin
MIWRRTLALALMLGLTFGCGEPDMRSSRAGAATSERAAAESPRAATGGRAIVTGTAPAGTIVTIEGEGEAPPPVPDGPVILDQYARQFIPSVLYARVGQTVEFRNSEDVDHNVQVLRMPAGITVMNESGSKGQVFTHVFREAGLYEVICDVHPGMRAAIVVTAVPRAAYAANRTFTFADVEPGVYVVRALSGGRETSQTVVVTAPETHVTIR